MKGILKMDPRSNQSANAPESSTKMETETNALADHVAYLVALTNQIQSKPIAKLEEMFKGEYDPELILSELDSLSHQLNNCRQTLLRLGIPT